jgi:formylglycine-generating enzyme
MADVFISYSREDRGMVDRLAKRLASYQISVWFDDRLEHASPFDRAIQNELSTARTVLVLWSPAASASEWVRAEAAHARDRGVLLMATIQTCVPPPPFNVMQAADLRQWVGTDNYSEWLKLVGAFGAKLSRPGLEPYALAQSSGLLLPLREWANTFPDDPLAVSLRPELVAKAREIAREEADLAELIELRRNEAEAQRREDLAREAKRRESVLKYQYNEIRHFDHWTRARRFLSRVTWTAALAAGLVGAVWLWRPDLLSQFAPPAEDVRRIWESGGAVDSSLPSGTVFQECADCPEMIVVPALADGTPFAIGRHEVTRSQFAAFIRAGVYSPNPGWCYARNFRRSGRWNNPGFLQTGQHPVVCVSVNDASAYAAWISGVTGADYRVPSDAEWEHAARGGVTSDFAYGETLSTDLANYAPRASGESPENAFGAQGDKALNRTAAVGAYPANRFGLHDIHGNAGEWTRDCVDGSVGTCTEAFVRGGSWVLSADLARFSQPHASLRDFRDDHTGFRIARALD